MISSSSWPHQAQEPLFQLQHYIKRLIVTFGSIVVVIDAVINRHSDLERREVNWVLSNIADEIQAIVVPVICGKSLQNILWAIVVITSSTKQD